MGFMWRTILTIIDSNMRAGNCDGIEISRMECTAGQAIGVIDVGEDSCGSFNYYSSHK